jgi:hypothetical protein
MIDMTWIRVGCVCVAASALALSGCAVEALGGGGSGSPGETSSGAGSTSSSTSGGDVSAAPGGPGEAPYVLVTNKAFPDGPCYYNAQENPPDALFLILSSHPISCDETVPFGADPNDCYDGPMVWEACFAIPTSAPATYDLPAAGVVAAEYTLNPSGPCCGLGSNISSAGTITVSALDSAHASFTISGTNQTMSCTENGPGPNLTTDGTYDAPRCP